MTSGAALHRGRRSEPCGERIMQPVLGSVSHPGHISVGPNQHGGGGSHRPDPRELPRTDVSGVDRLNAICPWSDVDDTGLTEVEQHGPGMVQQAEDPQRAVVEVEVEVRHAASEEWVPFAEVVMNVETGH